MSRSRAVLGVDPLDALLGESSARPKHPGSVAPASSRGKVRATFHLPRSLVDEARNATVALSGPPVRLTLARLVEEALCREVQRLRDTHNAGSPFPPREAELIGGRPIRS
jgi:hypothetical protein